MWIGKAKNVHFAFDTINDTAIDVATEMVKELEISDWDPSEIAMMIKNEISTLIPNWEEYHQDSFNYDEQEEDDGDDDDDESFVTRHPFYSCSSHASSSNSLEGFYSFYENSHHHILDGVNIDDDDTSSSFNYSEISFCSNNEDEYGRDPQCISTTKNPTRFCPTMKIDAHHLRYKDIKVMVDREAFERRTRSDKSARLTRVKSMVNLRSEALHRSLVEMLLKKRLFNTVDAMENIGYQKP